MPSPNVSAYRDRTSEFRSLSEKLKKTEGIITNTSSDTFEASTSSAGSQSEFKRKASRIGLGIFETSQKISRLAQLSKRSSMFDDPLVEIQELTALIKNDITSLNVAVSDLQTLQNLEIANENCSKDRAVHATTICDDLKTRLMVSTKQFQDVLTTRTENLKAHESRKQIFSREKPFVNHAKPLTEPPPWSNNNTSGISPPSTTTSGGVQGGNQLRRRLAADSSSSNMEVSMLQQVVPRQEDFVQNRASALQNVESTISELGGIFTQLATMVAQQGELAIRIDDNMDESLSNVEGARGALLKHLNQISSNRWLLIKIFAVLIFFLMVFVFFVV
ncbi:hypothetical protein IFM89_031446 [Coptis chinensis]|uniref:t-SNARE coiled-coil homology domain-containing protein n=1 Tax=Coptis chinensis TaxID=261450 RepID=A0A835LKB9_9MAGN|nr:hypothetical protein IFM89_031446 [Coptis chinensis]